MHIKEIKENDYLLIDWHIGVVVECSPTAREKLGFKLRSSHTKDSRNGTWYLLA